MFHGQLDKHTTQGLTILRDRIDAARVTPSRRDQSLNVATFNIRELGRRPRLDASIHYLAEILAEFDLISIVELRDDLTDLERIRTVLGPAWRVLFSDYNVDPAGNRERIAFLYDSRAVEHTGLAAEADPPRERRLVSTDPERYQYLPLLTWWRSPYMASFRSGHFEFVVLSAHVRWGGTVAERAAALALLADWVELRRAEPFLSGKDLIVMGDFNVPSRRSSTFKAITRHGLEVPPPLLKPDFGTNLARNKRYDQILHLPMRPEAYQDRRGVYRAAGGVLDFYAGDHRPLYPGRKLSKQAFTYELSDHLPLWIQLNTWYGDLQLADPG